MARWSARTQLALSQFMTHRRSNLGRSSRLPLRAVLHWERYDLTGEEEVLREYDRVMAATGIYEGRQVPVPGAPNHMDDYGWMEHSARRVSQARRQSLRPSLDNQGFPLR